MDPWDGELTKPSATNFPTTRTAPASTAPRVVRDECSTREALPSSSLRLDDAAFFRNILGNWAENGQVFGIQAAKIHLDIEIPLQTHHQVDESDSTTNPPPY